MENPLGLGERLLGMVDDYVALALAAREAGEAEGLEARLVAGMRAYLFGRAREHGCGQGDEELERLLGMDLRLNAQGLGVWLENQDGLLAGSFSDFPLRENNEPMPEDVPRVPPLPTTDKE